MAYDATRNLSSGVASILYTLIDGATDKKYAIQGKIIVRGAHDAANLQYELETTVLEKESHERLALYLSRETTSRSEAS